MKKKSLLVVCIVISMLLFGCGNEKVSTSYAEEKGIDIVTTVFAPFDFARQIVGEYGSVTMLVPPAAESHSYEPTPQDIIKIQNCDVFIYGGGESDEWVTDMLASIGNDKIKVIKMLDEVDAVEEEMVEGMQGDTHNHEHEEDKHSNETHEHHDETHEHSDEEIEYDEHVWTSPENAICIVEAIKEVVTSIDEAHSTVYEENAETYIKELRALHEMFQEVVNNGVRKEVIFADRFPLRYFVEAYGLSYYAAFPGCATDTEPSAATVAFLIDKVKEDEIPVVFHIELSNEKMADTIVEATGAKKLLFNACHTISKVDFESGVTYLDIMKQNVETLKEALN